MSDVLPAAGEGIVETDDGVTLRQKTLAGRGAGEAGAACHQSLVGISAKMHLGPRPVGYCGTFLAPPPSDWATSDFTLHCNHLQR